MVKSASKSRRESHGGAKQYASKVVGDVIDKLIAEELKNTRKNKKTVEKWLGKMKLSVQKKISRCTRPAYGDPEQSREAIKDKVSATRKEVKELSENVKAKVIAAMESSKRKFEVDVPSSSSKASWNFESRVSNITGSFQKVAASLCETRSKLVERTESMLSTYAAVEKGMDSPSRKSRPSLSSSGEGSGGGNASGDGSRGARTKRSATQVLHSQLHGANW